jgi:hypothetical protein
MKDSKDEKTLARRKSDALTVAAAVRILQAALARSEPVPKVTLAVAAGSVTLECRGDQDACDFLATTLQDALGCSCKSLSGGGTSCQCPI